MEHYCKLFDRTILLVIIYRRFQQQQRLLKQIMSFEIAKNMSEKKPKPGQRNSLLMTCYPSPFSHLPPAHPVLSHFQDELQISPPLPILPQSLSFPDYTRHMKQLKTVCTHSFQDTDNHPVSANQSQLHECCDNDRNCTYLYKSCTSLTWNVSLDHATSDLQQKEEKKINLQSFKLSTMGENKLLITLIHYMKAEKKSPPNHALFIQFFKVML